MSQEPMRAELFRRRRAGHGLLRAVALLVALFVAVTMAAACGGSTRKGGSPKTGGQLVWGKTNEIDQLDPAVSGSARAWDVYHLVYEGLIGIDEQLKPVPELAESWQQTSPTTYLFNLRKNAKFSNGRALTADDVIGSLERIMDKKVASLWAGQLGIKDVKADGDSRVTVTLRKPRASFLVALAGSPAKILPIQEMKAGTFDPKKTLLGTGPFKVAAHLQDESWTFDRNPYYWRPGVPKVEKLIARIIPDDSARMAALRDGSIDVTTFQTPDSARLLRGQANVKTVGVSSTDYYRLDVNAVSSVFRDDRLRQALSLAIDRNKIRAAALSGTGRPTAAVAASFEGVCDPAAMPFATPDLARAGALVKAAGATGKTVDIVPLKSVGMSTEIAQVLQQSLQAIGLKARVVQLDMGELVKRAYSGSRADFDLIVSGYAGYADPAMVLPWWNPEISVFNKSFLKPDAQLNKLIDTSLSTPPGAQRAQALRDACGRIAQDANVIPLLTYGPFVAYRSDKIAPVIPRTEGYGLPLRHISEFATK